uniref:Txe/YoeB family addiction module toxin n=1 Tax=Scandinavium goeteborgense TaxID=1851514 RepID=UPI00135C9C07|nr:Txe/YoeB family addiction module toxin [Scandinavium goeteborgense]
MKVAFTAQAKADLLHWLQAEPTVKDKIDKLICNALQDPRTGIGKPEALKHHKPLWSRRITKEHRLVYYVQDDTLMVVLCRFHYINL